MTEPNLDDDRADDDIVWRERVREWFEELDRVARFVSDGWPPGLSAVDAVREQRRQL